MTRRLAAVLLLLALAAPNEAPVIRAAGTSASVAATPGDDGQGLRSAPSGAEASSLPLAAPAVPEPIGSVAASPSGAISTAILGGIATWFDACAKCAAAGPALRSMLGPSWRGSVVTVEGPAGASVSVVLSEWCQCGDRHGLDTLIDLSREAFSRLAHPSAGIVAVTIELPAQLPSTDTTEEER